jgi:4-amino-4-deoxy-L-arabinose transferase-like glycosyltransferase
VTESRRRRLELAVLVALLVLAALTRLPGLAERGRWDADQGTDMLVLRALAVDGEVPLLGPRTSIGTFHHGAVYYYLLAPAAILSSADPVAVTGEIALFGIAAVAGAWWLGRLVGGPLAGALAGFLAAISPAGIDESTFIWNPNLIAAAAALAFAAAIQARRTGRARWWVASGTGAMVTMQCHVLGVVIVLPLLWAWGSDVLRRRRTAEPLAGAVRGGVGAALVIAAGYLPLLVHELRSDFSETRGILDYIAAGGREAATGTVDRVLMVGLRSVTWPISGLVTDRVGASLVALVILTVLIGIAVTRRPGRPAPERAADAASARWLLGALVVSVALLAVFAPSLAVVVPELPNDHYHAFLDPVVLALAGVGLAGLATSLPGGLPGRAAAATGTVVLALIAVTAWPPALAPDGGWPLADAAAARVLDVTAREPFALDGIPPFKNDNALRFPLERRGAAPPTSTTDAGVIVLVCDPLFDAVVGAPCGGPAEDDWLAAAGRGDLGLVDRFDAGSRRVISIFAAGVP